MASLHPRTYYYRRVITDAVRAVEAARTHPLVDPARVAVNGCEPGWRADAWRWRHWSPDLVAALPDVPFLCDFAACDGDRRPPGRTWKLVNYLKVHRTKVTTVFNTLSYVDGVNFAARARCPALFSVALMDTTCPPSTVYAARRHYAGPSHARGLPVQRARRRGVLPYVGPAALPRRGRRTLGRAPPR